MLAFFGLFFPAFVSEKLLMLVYFVLTPFFFRRSLLFFNPNNKFGVYLIFPLMHNNLFYYGFFNLCLGITAMFAVFSYYLRCSERIQPKQFLGLTLLLGLAFFSHMMAFLLALGLLLSFSFVFIELRKHTNRYRISGINNFRRRLSWVLICALPWLVLTFIYFDKIHTNGPIIPLSLSERVLWFKDFRPLLAFSYGPPLIDYGRVFSTLLFCLTALAVFGRLKQLRLFSTRLVVFDYQSLAASTIFFVFSVVLLILFFWMPNFILVCDRVLVFFYLFFFCWLTMLKYRKWVGVVSVAVIFYVQANIVNEYYTNARNSRKDLPQLEEMASHVPEGNLVIVLNYSGNWLYNHASGYIGANSRLAVLENYEAGIPWFPVLWNTRRFKIEPFINNLPSNKDLACSYFVNKPDTTFFSIKEKNGNLVPVDYVFQIGENLDQTNPCSAETFGRLESSYRLVRKNNFCKLYVRKGVQAQH
jgi:hypothetical protein